MRSQRTAVLFTLTCTLILFAGATAFAENTNPTFVITSMDPAPGSLLPETPSIVLLTGSQPIHPSTVTSQTVKVVTAGPDGVFDTLDDVRVIPTSLVAVGSTIKIGLPVQATPRERYQVNVVSLTGVSTPVLTLLPTLTPVDVAFGDMNGDGNPDITVGNTERIDPTVFLGDGMGKFGNGISLPWMPGVVHCIALADFNQDGMLDITGNAGFYVPILRNRGVPGGPLNFGGLTSLIMGGNNWVRARDINGDGKADLLSCYPHFYVLLNTTSPGSTSVSFEPTQSYPVESWQPPWEFQAGDLNGDGKLDIVSCHREGAVITALLNLTPPGSMTPAFSNTFTFATNGYAKYVELGDINGDGKPDAIVANSQNDNIQVLLNTTEKNSLNVTFSPPWNFAAAGSPSYISIADMDKDGKMDIISAQSKSSESIVLLNTTQAGAGVPTFAAPMRFPAGPMPVAAMGGDLTGKGHMGVVSACPTANCIAITYLPTSVQTTGGINVDGEFSGTFPTGNGIAGGSFKATFDVGVPSTTPTTLSATAPTVIYGDLGATLTATVTSPGQVVNNGVVTFQVMNGTIPAGPAISSTVSNGATSLAYTIPAGLRASTALSIQAKYGPNLIFGGSTDNSQRIVIQTAPLTISARDATTAYGTLPTLAGTIAGLKNNDPISVTYSISAGQFSAVGSYPIVPSISDPAGRLANYAVTVTNGNLLITPALLLAAPLNHSRPYGTSNPVLSGTFSGALNGDDVQVAYESAATSRSAVGSYTITPRLLPTEGAGNYALMPVTGMLSVTPAPLRAAATSATRAYGSDNPSFTGTVEGILNGDDIRVAFATQAASASPVGTYPIAPQLIQTTAAGNYSFEAISASFTITPAALTIAADNATRVYCAPNPVFSATISGARPGETIQLAFDTTAAQYTPVGTYTLVPRIANAAQAANYSVQTTNATLTVAKAAPSIVWTQPDNLAPGIALSATQLNARARDANTGAPLAGRYVYTPDIGAVLAVGTNDLKLSFVPSDSVNYESATASTTIFIGSVNPPPSPAGVAPSITSGLSATGAKDFAFAYLITATGTAPIAFLAENLPPGITHEGSTLVGTPSSAGTYSIKLTATNGVGSDTKFLNLTVSAPGGNHPPSWSSALLATANPVLVGTPVTIVSQAVDPDGDSLHYVWEFGDGTVGSGASVSKTYSSAGSFTVKLTVTDGQTSITQNLNLQVAALAVNQPIAVQKVDVAFNFVRRNHSLVMSGKVPLHAGYEPTGTTVRIVVGGLDKTFVLNPKGVSSDKTFKLKAARGKSLASFSLSLKDQALFTMLEGLGFSQTQSNTNVSFPVIVSVNGFAYSDEPVLRYTAKVGKSGPVSGRGKN